MKSYKHFINEQMKIKKTVSGTLNITKGDIEYSMYDVRKWSDTGKDKDPWMVKWEYKENGWDKEDTDRFRTKQDALNFIKNHKV